MHEWALAESILVAALEAAEKEKLKTITEIKIAIEIGRASCRERV